MSHIGSLAMATVDLNSLQLWTPSFNPFLDKQQKASSYSKAGSISKTTSSQHQPALLYNKADQIFRGKDPFTSTITTPQRQEDGFAAGVQGSHDARSNCDNEADDEFPSIEEYWSQNLQQGISTEYPNSDDILQYSKESALDTSGSPLSPERSRLGESAGNSQDKPVILDDDTPDLEVAAVSVLVDAHADSPFEPSKEPWYDVKDECFLDEDLRPIPPLEQRGFASTIISMPAQDQPRSLHHSPGPSQDQINLYELNNEVHWPLQEPEEIPSTGAPTSPCPYRSSIDLPHPQIDQEGDRSGIGHGRLEEFRRSSALRSQYQEEPQDQQQRQEVARELMRKDDDGDNEQRELQGEEQLCRDGNKEMCSANYPKSNDCSHNTREEDDEDPRPVKRRKLPPSPTNNALTPPNEPTSVDDDQYHPPRASRSPSAQVESAPVAEYQEWPFKGFLKRTRIGTETMYNLGFTLPRIQDHVHLCIPSEALDNGSDIETLTGVGTFHSTMAHSKVRPAVSQSRLKRVRWTPEEDATIVRMKEDGCSWEEIHAALPHRTQGTIQVHYSTKLKKEPQ